MIVTVTLNPAVDEGYLLPEFHPGGWFRSDRRVERTPGGRGINVSMTLQQLGYENAAMGFLAGFNGEYVRDALRRAHITTNFVHVSGETRTNVYIVDEIGHIETGLAELGPYIPEEALARFFSNYERMLHRCSMVCLGGSLPPGVPQDIYRDLVNRAKDRNIATFVDAEGPALMAVLEAVPTVVKVDHRYMSRVAGIATTSLDKVIEIVSRVHEKGVDYALTSYRTYGYVFHTPQGVFLEEMDRKGVVSLFGSSEALMAGLVVARAERMPVDETLRFAMACAQEDSFHVEKGVRGRREVEAIMDQVHLEKLA